MLVSFGGRQWPVDGLHKKQCSHQPTAGVRHKRILLPFGLYDNRKGEDYKMMDQDDKAMDKDYYMIDKCYNLRIKCQG
jgi:hypothetical protein